MVAIQQYSSPVTEGDNVTFYCNATGNPSPNITWTRANSSAGISFSEMFHMEAVKRNESGSYVCHASNGFGTHNTSCSVDVLCKLYWGAKGQGHVLFFPNLLWFCMQPSFQSFSQVCRECCMQGQWIKRHNGDTLYFVLLMWTLSRAQMFVSDCICILHGLSDLVKKEFYCRKTKENTTVCLDSERQKAAKKCGYSLS